jgi:alkaline phosphatase D
MMIRRLICALAIGPAVATGAVGQEPRPGPRPASDPSVVHSDPLARIAFGSCATQEKPQPIWDAVLAARPQLLLLLGDNIYADTEDMDVMRRKYAKLAAVPGFQAIRKACPILATWDDHDLGANDAGGDYPRKDESQKVFLDFFGDAADSPRRHRPGVYDARVFGPEGKRVQVILLDTRYFRSRLKRDVRALISRGPYVASPDADATILGEDQWRWLAEQLNVPAEIRIIASSIQVVAEDHGWEKWMNFPRERERLFALIRHAGVEGVILLSGDRHLAELSMMDAGVGYPIYDLTSSGLNQAARAWRPLEENRHRVATMNWGDNFGLVAIDWDRTDPLISLQVRDVEGDIRIQQKIDLVHDLHRRGGNGPLPPRRPSPGAARQTRRSLLF